MAAALPYQFIQRWRHSSLVKKERPLRKHLFKKLIWTKRNMSQNLTHTPQMLMILRNWIAQTSRHQTIMNYSGNTMNLRCKAGKFLSNSIRQITGIIKSLDNLQHTNSSKFLPIVPQHLIHTLQPLNPYAALLMFPWCQSPVVQLASKAAIPLEAAAYHWLVSA